jgi:ABC-2 type transport system permease protein
VLWYLPLMGYLMLVSAFAKRAVMLWAVLPPLVITVLEKQFFDSDYFARLIADRLSGVMPLAFDAGVGGRWGVDAGKDLVIRSPGLEVINPGPLLTSPGLWLGLLVAAAFLAGAVYLRRYRDESI